MGLGCGGTGREGASKAIWKVQRLRVRFELHGPFKLSEGDNQFEKF